MSLKELLNKYGVSENLEMQVAYLLAHYGVLGIDTEDDGVVYEDDLNAYDWDEIVVNDYDLTSGCYHNQSWFSLDKIIRCMVECEEVYE